MNVPDALLRELLDAWPVARLSTITPAGRPHAVPIVYAREGDAIYCAIDGKAKQGRPLQREANVLANPAVAVLLDEYGPDWDRLWWVRLDGEAGIYTPDADRAETLRVLLQAKYAQYRRPGMLPAEPTYLRMTWQRASGWAQNDLHGALRRAAASGRRR